MAREPRKSRKTLDDVEVKSTRKPRKPAEPRSPRISNNVRVESAVLIMRRDPKYKKLKHTFDTHENFQLALEDLTQELMQSHQNRLVRRLNYTDPKFVDAVINASIKEQATRSRITEIMVQCMRSHTLLNNAIESLKYHLLVTYTDELRSFRTKEERMQIVNMALRTFNKYLGDLLAVKESAQLMAADIDKSSWNLKLIVEAMKLHIARESSL